MCQFSSPIVNIMVMASVPGPLEIVHIGLYIYIDLCSAFTAIETHTFCDGQLVVFNTFGGTHDKPWRRLITVMSL